MGIENIGIGMTLSTTYSATQLIKLGKSEAFSLVDDDRVDVWEIESCFDDGGRDQDIVLALVEVQHDLFQNFTPQLPMRYRDAGIRNVLMGYRPTGGVLMREMSRMPTMDDSNVRGMGVALRVSTSTSVFIFLIFSLSSTPKSCSSSTIIKPMSLKSPAMFRTLCVPTAMSTPPSCRSLRPTASSLEPTILENSATLYPIGSKRASRLRKCCIAKMVVGAMTATCLPFATARAAARMATSVFPKPTSPHTRRSIGLPASMSARTSAIALD